MSLHRSFFPTQNILQLSTYSNLLLHKTNQVLWLPAWKSYRILSENHSEADDVFDCFYLQTGYCGYIRNWLIFVYFILHIFYLAERRTYSLAMFPVIIHKKISESKRRAPWGSALPLPWVWGQPGGTRCPLLQPPSSLRHRAVGSTGERQSVGGRGDHSDGSTAWMEKYQGTSCHHESIALGRGKNV